jgi:uncharacterized protein (DUF885 family)
MRASVLLCALVLFGAGCSSANDAVATTFSDSPATETTTSAGTTAPTTTEPASDFQRTADAITTSLLVLQPELVTELGAGLVIGFDADYQLNDLSLRGAEELAEAARDGLAILDGLQLESLTPYERVSAEVLRWYLEDQVTMAGYVAFDNPVNFITGAHSNFPEFMADVHPITTEQDAENYVERLNGYPEQIRDLIQRLEEAESQGIVPTDGSLAIARWQIQNNMGTGDVENHPLVLDLRDRVAALPDEERAWAAGIGARAEAIVDKLIVPALEELDQAVRRIDGRSNAEAGLTYVPGGDEYYAAVLKHYISIDLSPEEVHLLGESQVERAMAEMTACLDELGYDAGGNFARAIRAAADDAGAMPTTNQTERMAVLDRTTATIAAAKAAFADLFTVRPIADLDVVRPRPGREGGSGAYYRSPPLDGSRNGLYYLSLGGSEFGVLTMDTTTYHEGIPGHHFQLGVQRALTDLPLHQRVFDFTGYAEGWALYAERLASEAGLYDDDPLGDLGRLRMELLRAARMVVDTGIHWEGWSRNEAVDYMLDLGFDRGRVEAEVDRYIVWPGQAPAYMVGMLEILRLRDKAETELGERFDLVGFHDALLSQGSVPVALLEDVVDMWVESIV